MITFGALEKNMVGRLAASNLGHLGRPVAPLGSPVVANFTQVALIILPIAKSAVATEAAKRYVSQMGIREPYVTLAEGNRIDFFEGA